MEEEKYYLPIDEGCPSGRERVASEVIRSKLEDATRASRAMARRRLPASIDSLAVAALRFVYTNHFEPMLLFLWCIFFVAIEIIAYASAFYRFA